MTKVDIHWDDGDDSPGPRILTKRAMLAGVCFSVIVNDG